MLRVGYSAAWLGRLNIPNEAASAPAVITDQTLLLAANIPDIILSALSASDQRPLLRPPWFGGLFFSIRIY
jgi:hypothetical protein